MPDAGADVLLSPLCAAAAAGRTDVLPTLAQAAIDGGWRPAQVREALLTAAPFCGFPRALDALAAVRPTIGPTGRGETPGPLRPRGEAFFGAVYGRDAARVRANLEGIDAEVAGWIVEDAYGRVLSRDGISASLRERIAVVLLAAQGLRNQLSGHARGALNCGAKAEELTAFIEAAAPFLEAEELEFARETAHRVTSRS